MSALVYFSSASGNTTRFVEGCRLDEFGIHTMRIPLRPDEPELHVDEPYVLLTPTYGGEQSAKQCPCKSNDSSMMNATAVASSASSHRVTPTSAKPTASRATSSR